MPSDFELDFVDVEVVSTASDAKLEEAKLVVAEYFKEHSEEVVFSKQMEVKHEGRFYHWLTNKALHSLEQEGLLLSERRALSWGGSILLSWNRKWRYPKRAAREVTSIVEEYSAPRIGGHLGPSW